MKPRYLCAIALLALYSPAAFGFPQCSPSKESEVEAISKLIQLAQAIPEHVEGVPAATSEQLKTEWQESIKHKDAKLAFSIFENPFYHAWSVRRDYSEGVEWLTFAQHMLEAQSSSLEASNKLTARLLLNAMKTFVSLRGSIDAYEDFDRRRSTPMLAQRDFQRMREVQFAVMTQSMDLLWCVLPK